MCNKEPKVSPEGVYNVKETAGMLEIHRDTLARRRKEGRIRPLNPGAGRGFRYKGEEILRFWRTENFLAV